MLSVYFFNNYKFIRKENRPIVFLMFSLVYFMGNKKVLSIRWMCSGCRLLGSNSSDECLPREFLFYCQEAHPFRYGRISLSVRGLVGNYYIF